MTHVTCRLTTKNQDQLRNPMLGSQVWATLCLYLIYLLPRDTRTHPFNGPLYGTTRVSRYQKGKTNLDFTEARDSEWQWHQLGHVQVSTSLHTDNHAHTPPLSFLQAGCPSCRPTNSVKALKACKLLQREHVLIISAELLIMC